MRMQEQPTGIRYYVFDKQQRTVRELEDDGFGDPLVVQWCRRMGDMGEDGRVVALDVVPDMHARVSTVFLGVDPLHDFALHAQPLLFETMIFDNDDGHALDAMKTATLDDAEAAHAFALQGLRSGVRPS